MTLPCKDSPARPVVAAVTMDEYRAVVDVVPDETAAWLLVGINRIRVSLGLDPFDLVEMWRGLFEIINGERVRGGSAPYSEQNPEHRREMLALMLALVGRLMGWSFLPAPKTSN